jgi:hypothetical protein
MSELIQAIVLMAHFHAFASFALGCGFFEGKKQRERIEKGNVPTKMFSQPLSANNLIRRNSVVGKPA